LTDLDPQGNTSTAVGIDPNQRLRNVYGIMLGNTCIDDAMVDTAIDGLKLIPATVDLSAIEVKLSEADGRQ